ncbi:PREDICTED: uncharacterized protein LOC101304993 [Fragaria vesca subsp. vesca]|uniref:uncharacterized protein LOC101304993 n=1 Tax=Fragaria vesca subsp. vesca TaxID=101020 RepID=UPI0002C308EB|nr:PREDICTED: uncharacterized protein LOC101304993 [Fragaria vesca subsp. vesca]
MRGRRRRTLPSGSTEANKLPDLPEEIIIEIIVRLPRNSVARSKCLSKRWYTLISNPDFLARFLSLQSEMKPPLENGMIFTDYNSEKYSSFTAMSQLPKSVKHRLGKRGSCTVLATYNDLVLCFRDHYYNICNLHTMQCVALPPTLPHHDELKIAEVGLICEPYYKEQNGSTSRTIILNDEYKCRVVLIYEFSGYSKKICIDIFFSETGEWREYVVICPTSAREYCSIDNGAAKRSYNNSGGLAYNGKLYWLGEAGIMELDPMACDSNTSSRNLIDRGCRFIQFQTFGNPMLGKRFLGVCRGCMCLMSCLDRYNFEIYKLESGDDDQLDGGKWCFTLATQWCMPLNRRTGALWVLSLDPFIEDCFYLISMSGYFGKCYMRTGVIEYNSVKRCHGFGYRDSFGAFPFVLPWWPTPVPRIKHDPRQPAVQNGIDILCSLLLDRSIMV